MSVKFFLGWVVWWWWYIPIIISNQTIVKFEFGVLLILELLVVAIFQPLENLHRTVSNMAVERFVTDGEGLNMLPSSVTVNPNSIAIDWTEMVLIPIIPTPTHPGIV